MTSVKDILKDLSVIKFKYTNKADERDTFGIVAQELVEFFPIDKYSIVSQDKNGNYMVDYIQLIPLLLTYIRDLETRIQKFEGEK